MDNILQATMELLARGGVRKLSTDAIARHAGVSIGSLYQYFPNKEAILLALYEEASSKVAQAIKEVLLEVISMPPEKALKIIVRSLIDLYERDRLVLLQLVRDLPELSLPTMPLSVDNLIRNSMKTYIRLHVQKGSKQQVETRVFLMENAVIHTIQTFVANQPQNISRRQLVDDLIRIVIYYLTAVPNR